MAFLAWPLLACFLVAAIGTWLARAYALHRNLFDAPGERRAHTVPTPRGGGIAIVGVLLVAGVVLLRAQPVFAFALPGLALVALVGLIDDHRSISPWVRLAVHGIAAAMLAFGVLQAGMTPATAAVAFVLALALTNIWNFMDGIDGIAATQAVLVGLAVATAGQDPWSGWAWALVAATLGFLPFNFPFARIFLGDVGSGALGFAIAVLLTGRIAFATPDHAVLWLLPISAFAIDATLTLGRRILRRERWWQPHAQHAYQAWARRAGSHVGPTLGYAAWTIASVLLMRELAWAQGSVMLLACAAWYIAGAGIWSLLQGHGLRKKQDAADGSAAVKETTE